MLHVLRITVVVNMVASQKTTRAINARSVLMLNMAMHAIKNARRIARTHYVTMSAGRVFKDVQLKPLKGTSVITAWMETMANTVTRRVQEIARIMYVLKLTEHALMAVNQMRFEVTSVNTALKVDLATRVKGGVPLVAKNRYALNRMVHANKDARQAGTKGKRVIFVLTEDMENNAPTRVQ